MWASEETVWEPALKGAWESEATALVRMSLRSSEGFPGSRSGPLSWGPTLLTFVSTSKSSRRDLDPWRLGRRSDSKDAVQSIVLHPILLNASSLLGPPEPQLCLSAKELLCFLLLTRGGRCLVLGTQRPD